MVQWGTVDIMGMWTKQRWDIDIAGSDSQQVNIPKSQLIFHSNLPLMQYFGLHHSMEMRYLPIFAA